MLILEDEQIAHLPITVDPETMSGAPVFRGTRVPVTAMLDSLVAGLTLNEFLDNFPTVRPGQAVRVLAFNKDPLPRLGRAA